MDRATDRLKANWPSYLIELMVVFISITSAFLLENWREDRHGRELGKKFVESIFKEVKQDSTALDLSIEQNTKRHKFIEDYLSNRRNNRSDLSATNNVLLHVMGFHMYALQSSAYESIKYSGNLNLIERYELREKIVKYHNESSELQLLQQFSMDYIYNYITEFFVSKVDMDSYTLISKSDLTIRQMDNYIMMFNTLLRNYIQKQQSCLKLNTDLQKEILGDS